MKFVFRVDASTKMGSGHVMRCLTLAEELKKNGSDVSFISRAHEGNLNYLISKKGFQVHELLNLISTKLKKKSNKGDNYERWLGTSEDNDAQETIKTIGIDKPDWLIVDHYALSEKWEKTVRPTVKNIMVIDDLANRIHDCDMLLDQNWFENMETRYKGLVPANCTQLLGPKYALLRPEFYKARKSLKKRNEKVDRIFVFFGGSDPHNLTGMTLRALSEPELAYLKVDIVIGENNPHHEELKKLTTSRVSTNLHIQVDDIVPIMANADLAIGSGGVNTWERICLNLESLVISFADNHEVLIRDLAKNIYVDYLGLDSNLNISIFKKAFKQKIHEMSIKKYQNNELFEIVNGKGVDKVSSELLKKFTKITIVSDNDSWINDFIPEFFETIKIKKYSVNWVHNFNELENGDICFLISCSQIMSKNSMSKNKINLVVHESALPKGKGWSPLTWQILEGKNNIPIYLLEVSHEVDSGKVFLKDEMVFNGFELIDELREIQAQYTFKLCENFINQYPQILDKGKEQQGKSSYYNKRGPSDSEIEVKKSILENFNLLRTVDNNRYPAFFYLNGKKYKLQIEKYD